MHRLKQIKYLIAIFTIPVTCNYSFALECPEFPTQTTNDWSAEIKTAVGKLGPAKAGELEVKLKETTYDLLAKLPKADNIYLEQMMFAAYCTALRDDKSQTELQKSILLREYRDKLKETLKKQNTEEVSKQEIIENQGFQFLAKQCSTRKDKRIVCKLIIKNIQNTRKLMIANNKSIILYDNKGNQTNIYSVSLGNVEATMSKYGGASIQRMLPRNVPIDTTLVFNPTFAKANVASEIIMEFQTPRFKVSLVDIPIK